ncbi:helix-turn-helix domain-containing protein [Actinoplanes philippinensis]|uniref:helix-turn-helix domain-containing protein n=1 Tax=Actinoplanes philippinensis TaxID=35752 RepID=UPI0034007853
MLSELKARRGISYQALGRKVNLSKSAVHRYCSGSAVPSEFGTVERIARATGADRRELHRLYVVWTRAAASGPNEIPDETGLAAEPAPEPLTERTPRTWPMPRRWLAAVLVTGVFLLLNGLGPGSGAGEEKPTDAQWISGPSWTLPATPVSERLFGVTINSTTGTMPSFAVGSIRLWDSGTLWAALQPRRGVFDWTLLDGHVEGAAKAKLPALFVIGGTPGWAAPTGRRAPYPEDARAVPPDDLADWDAFVRALVARYAGRIEAYELWVLGNDSRFYNGSVETLVDMTRRASRIIRKADPAATVVCPGMGNLWTPAGREVLRRFAELRGYDHCDVAAIKLHQRSAAEPPETMLQLTGVVDTILHSNGVHPRVWNTGTMYEIPLQGHLPETMARDYAVRFFLVGLLARETNLERMYFYNWGGARVPIVLQADGGAPTPAARAIEVLEQWLADAEVHSCGHGPAVDLPDNAWQCVFTVVDGGQRRPGSIVWTHDGTAAIVAGSDVTRLRRLDGTSAPVEPGARLEITEEPILIVRT